MKIVAVNWITQNSSNSLNSYHRSENRTIKAAEKE